MSCRSWPRPRAAARLLGRVAGHRRLVAAARRARPGVVEHHGAPLHKHVPVAADGGQFVEHAVRAGLLDRPEAGFPGGCSSDGERVFVVTLGTATSSTSFRGAPGRHLAGVVAGGCQALGDVTPMPGRPFDANAHDLDRLVGQPLQGLPQPVIGVGKAHHREVGAETVDQADGDAVLVRVDPADCLLHVLPFGRCHGGQQRRDQRGNAGFSRAGSFQASTDPAVPATPPGRSASGHAGSGQRNGGPGRDHRTAHAPPG
jgi:hypothetical protein